MASTNNSLPNVTVLYDGFSYMEDGEMFANCSCTLIKGSKNVIVDTMTAWDRDKVLIGLSENGLSPDDIDYAVATHGHSDHTGNMNLFTKATFHITGFTISNRNKFYIHPFEMGEAFSLSDDISVIPTPGHMGEDVSVVVKSLQGTIVVAGDLFEKEADIVDERIWKITAGSQNPETQELHRKKVIEMADYIVPGHGPMFKVTSDMKKMVLGLGDS